MDQEDLHSESLKWTVRDVAPKIDGLTVALDRISSDIKGVEKWLDESGVRAETEVVYSIGPLSGRPADAGFRPDQGRITSPPRASAASPLPVPSTHAPQGLAAIVDPDLATRLMDTMIRNFASRHQRMRRVWRRFHAIAWAPMPDGRWRLQFREYQEDGIAFLDEETGECFEDEEMEVPAERVSLRPLIETPAPIRFQVGTNQILERLLLRLAEEIPDYGPSDMLKGLGVK